MELFQNIMVLFIFIIAVGYMITKFIWKPSFLKKTNDKNCGGGSCGC